MESKIPGMNGSVTTVELNTNTSGIEIKIPTFLF